MCCADGYGIVVKKFCFCVQFIIINANEIVIEKRKHIKALSPQTETYAELLHNGFLQSPQMLKGGLFVLF